MAGRSYRHIKRPAPWTRCPDYDALTSLFVNKHGEKHVSSRARVGGILHNLMCRVRETDGKSNGNSISPKLTFESYSHAVACSGDA